MKKRSEKSLLENELFIRWIRTDDAELAAYWKDWINANPERVNEFIEARAILKNLKFRRHELTASQQSQLLEKVWAQVGHHGTQQRKPSRMWLAASIAASLLLLLGLTLWQVGRDSQQIVSTDFGEWKALLLADSTQVDLNANSTLSYDAQDPRQVYLQGEAFFQVTRKPLTDEEFLVHTEDLSIRVLGTSFNVNNRNGTTSVFLEEGVITLEIDGQETITMEPGDLLSYSKSTKQLSEVRKSISVENTSWKDGTLVFRQTQLVAVLHQLEEIYGVSLEVSDSTLGTRLISGGVPIKNLQIALNTLQGIYDLKIEEMGSDYLISQ